MAKLILVLVLLFSMNAFATKQEVYFKGCYDSFLSMVRALTPVSEDKAKQESKDMCLEAKKHWDEAGWSNVYYPEYQGCINASEMMYLDPIKSAKNVSILKKNYCSKYLK